MRVNAVNGSLGGRAVIWAVCGATAMLVYVGSRAIWSSRDAARRLLERREAEQLTLLLTALTQDMRGAHTSILASISSRQLSAEPPYDLADTFARGFARFPYPESFFSWRDSTVGGGAYMFNRSNRPPPWRASDTLTGPYPVELVRNAREMRGVIAELRARASGGDRPLIVVETELEGTLYQIVARPFFDDEEPSDDRDGTRQLLGIVGFTVNLGWVRRHYFQELTLQISQIAGDTDDVTLAVLDTAGTVVTRSRAPRPGMPPLARPFPLLFADHGLLRALGPRRFATWSAQVSAANDSRLAAQIAGTSWTFVLLSIAAAIGTIGLLMTARSARAASQLAAMKSDFVSSVTHELKRPLSVIQLVADTLVRRRYASADAVQSYATLLSRESQNLQRLIENMLAYARLSDPDHAFRFLSTNIHDVVNAALERFDTLLAERQFTVDVNLPDRLPAVRADRSALMLVFDNLIDNAIKYSDGTTVLQISAASDDGHVTVSIADSGIGIADDEIKRVCDKFFRGRTVKAGGSGLGLAIVHQVVDAHRGMLRIQSAPGQGTRVDVLLPVNQL